eukprot:11245094-Alexandrium_andersonii.AAC.1
MDFADRSGQVVVLRVLPGTTWNGPPGFTLRAWLRWAERGSCRATSRRGGTLPSGASDTLPWAFTTAPRPAPS